MTKLDPVRVTIWALGCGGKCEIVIESCFGPRDSSKEPVRGPPSRRAEIVCHSPMALERVALIDRLARSMYEAGLKSQSWDHGRRRVPSLLCANVPRSGFGAHMCIP